MKSNNNTDWQRLPNETAEHYNLFVGFCQYNGNIKEYFDTKSINTDLSFSAITKIASPQRHNWIQRKKVFLKHNNSKQGYDINSIKDNLLSKINELTANSNTLNMQNIEILTNCFCKLVAIDCETKQQVKSNTKDTSNFNSNSNNSKQISNKMQTTSIKQVSNSKQSASMNNSNQTAQSLHFDYHNKDYPVQLANETEKEYQMFCNFITLDLDIKAFATAHSKEFDLSINWTRKIAQKNKWIARKQQF